MSIFLSLDRKRNTLFSNSLPFFRILNSGNDYNSVYGGNWIMHYRVKNITHPLLYYLSRFLPMKCVFPSGQSRSSLSSNIVMALILNNWLWNRLRIQPPLLVPRRSEERRLYSQVVRESHCLIIWCDFPAQTPNFRITLITLWWIIPAAGIKS